MATSLELRALDEFYSILFRNMLQILAWLHYNTLWTINTCRHIQKLDIKIDFICIKNTYSIRSISFMYEKVGLVSKRFIDANWNSRKSREILWPSSTHYRWERIITIYQEKTIIMFLDTYVIPRDIVCINVIDCMSPW